MMSTRREWEGLSPKEDGAAYFTCTGERTCKGVASCRSLRRLPGSRRSDPAQSTPRRTDATAIQQTTPRFQTQHRCATTGCDTTQYDTTQHAGFRQNADGYRAAPQKKKQANN